MGRECLSCVAGRQSIVRVLAAARGSPADHCTGLVRSGRVAIRGRIVRDLEARADPFQDLITVDGQPLTLANVCRYLLLNKPFGVLCAFTDPDGRPTLADYVDVAEVYAAGRLDLDSEGLVLLTNDGWLIHRLAHPRFHQPKTYLVQVERKPDEAALEALRVGVILKGSRTAPAEAEILQVAPDLPPRPKAVRKRLTVPTAWLRVVLTEGRKRQVRHMTAAVGHPTLRLVRTAIGPLTLGDLQPGGWRDLTREELTMLKSALGRAAPPGGRPHPPSSPPRTGRSSPPRQRDRR